MIQYREMEYQKWFEEREEDWYKNDRVFLNDYAVSNLKVYVGWVVRIYWEKYGHDKVKILEPGCRMGEAGAAIAQMFSPDDVVYEGMEISKKLIADSRTYHNRSFYGDICNCPELISESYDIVFSRTLFGFLRDIPAAVKNMIRLARRVTIMVQPTPVVMGVHHYASMDNLDDLRDVLKGFNYSIMPSIPVYDRYGRSVFGEQILIVEK